MGKNHSVHGYYCFRFSALYLHELNDFYQSDDEFRTSKLCSRCHKELCHSRVKNDDKNEKVCRCLVCKECESSESKGTVFWNRDLNAALNIRNLAIEWLATKTHPPEFLRGRREE
jgi:transposase